LPYEKEANKQTPPTPRSVICHNITHSTTQYVIIAQKYAQALRFRIPNQMSKNILWIFRFLSSNAMTSVIIQIWRLKFVLERSILRFGKQIEVCIM
jgi:hypothetical protein